MAEQESRPGVTYGEHVLRELLPLLADFIESCNEQARPGVIDALYRYLDAQSALLLEQSRIGRRSLPPPGSQDFLSSLPPDLLELRPHNHLQLLQSPRWVLRHNIS